MTQVERDIETLREACLTLTQPSAFLGALDRLVAALHHEQQAKEQAIERWRNRTPDVSNGGADDTPQRRRRARLSKV